MTLKSHDSSKYPGMLHNLGTCLLAEYGLTREGDYILETVQHTTESVQKGNHIRDVRE